MTSILKVDTIQTAAGGTPTAADLGLNVSGSVLQVVSTLKTDWFTSSSTSFVDVTGYSATITPTSTSSKILVLVDVFIAATDITAGWWQLVRNTTPVAIGTETASHNVTGGFYSETGTSSGYAFTGNGLSYLDSPATTSAVTYKVQAKSSGGNVTINKRGTDGTTSAVSTITLIEIAG